MKTIQIELPDTLYELLNQECGEVDDSDSETITLIPEDAAAAIISAYYSIVNADQRYRQFVSGYLNRAYDVHKLQVESYVSKNDKTNDNFPL